MKNIKQKYFKTLILLFLIVVIGGFLRFYRLGEVPVGFHQDEAFFGYNAYSILKTGRDMTGNFLPLHLQSFWYSPDLYSYFTIPFIALFSLAPFAVRFPSALFGTFSIIGLYLLTKELFRNYKYNNILALVSSFFLAINPWSINLARTATENTIVTFFIIAGTLAFLYWIRLKKLYLLFISFLLFFISLFIYQAPLGFLPLFIPTLLVFAYKKISLKKLTYFFALYVIVIVLPVLIVLTSPVLSARFKSLSIFAFPSTKLLIRESIVEDGLMKQSPIVARLFNNKPTFYGAQIVGNYFNQISYNFFFTDQALPLRYKVPDMGLLYLFELPLLLLGVFFLLKQKKTEGIFVLVWVLLSPVSSSITFDDIPNLQRTVMMYPALAIIGGFGLLQIFITFAKYKKYLKIFTTIFCAIVIYSVLYYQHQYFVQQVIHKPVNRQEGYKNLVVNVNTLLPSYEKANITGTAGSPAILFLFFSKYDPSSFQRQVASLPIKTVEYIDRVHFDKYYFYNQDCFSNYQKNTLYVERGSCGFPGSKFGNIKEIKREDGSSVFRIFALKK